MRIVSGFALLVVGELVSLVRKVNGMGKEDRVQGVCRR
jgi:hypothetical protein